ncbi:hypothetical protein T484DRAFT_1842061 [Baffinella frigidus]|nr:hypothetical protein T484DRAFT_1842061 [Cryptophyta sp. CCMP2293]
MPQLVKERSMTQLVKHRSMPQLVKQPSARNLCLRTQSAAASSQGYTRLHEDAAIINHRAVEDLRTRKWENAESTITSAFFLLWAMCTTLAVANQLLASVVHLQVAVAVLAATCTLVVFSRINRQAPGVVRAEMPK